MQSDLPVEELYGDPDFNCRGVVTRQDAQILADQIKKSDWVATIQVQPWKHPTDPKIKYRVIAGHRRLEACKLLKRPTIPAEVVHFENDLKARLHNLNENVGRKQLNIMQEANGIKPFIASGWTQKEIAYELGQPTGWVFIRSALLNLEPEIQLVAAAGFLTQDQIKQVASIPSKQGRFDYVKGIKEAKLRGDKPTILARKKPFEPLRRKKRTPEECFQMIEHILDCGFGYKPLATRALSWSAGEISDIDFIRDIREECERVGIPYIPPPELKHLVNL